MNGLQEIKNTKCQKYQISKQQMQAFTTLKQHTKHQNRQKTTKSNRQTIKKAPKTGKFCFFYRNYGNFSLISFAY